MFKVVFGVMLTLFVINYDKEIKSFAVETGIRDYVVGSLNNW
jgi:hypothetical protein